MDVSIPELELQQELQRFTTRFVDRISQATEVLQGSSRLDVRDEALRKALLYGSSALEIATGPAADVNLLDMFVFVRLSRTVLEKHWIPDLYGSDGAELSLAFEKADEEIVGLADRALGADKREQLAILVEAWVSDNPGQVRVEGIRLADFATLAGNAAADRALRASGLLSSVKTATKAANEAMLLAERGMFLLHRMPFLLRLQVRLGAREILGDTRVSTAPQLATLARVAKRGMTYAAVLGTSGFMWATRRRRA